MQDTGKPYGLMDGESWCRNDAYRRTRKARACTVPEMQRKDILYRDDAG